MAVLSSVLLFDHSNGKKMIICCNFCAGTEKKRKGIFEQNTDLMKAFNN